jgi:hypothetical protein
LYSPKTARIASAISPTVALRLDRGDDRRHEVAPSRAAASTRRARARTRCAAAGADRAHALDLLPLDSGSIGKRRHRAPPARAKRLTPTTTASPASTASCAR